MKRRTTMIRYLFMAAASYSAGVNFLLRSHPELAGASWIMTVLSMGFAGWYSQ